MSLKKRSKHPDLVIGAMPVEAINKALGMELEPGQVILTRSAQKHAASRHPDDYAICEPHLSSVISDPKYIGDDFKNRGSIEIWGYVGTVKVLILIAIDSAPNEAGAYRINSFYLGSEKKAQGRRQKGFLRIVAP